MKTLPPDARLRRRAPTNPREQELNHIRSTILSALGSLALVIDRCEEELDTPAVDKLMSVRTLVRQVILELDDI